MMDDRLQKELETRHSADRGGSSDPQQKDLSAFLKFPSLSRLFQGADRTALTEMRSQLIQTNQGFERVIRQGTKEDADRAALISRSYDLALGLLDELERQLAETTK
jgi:hypothetical protein